jgi:hypothetical protein
MKNKTITVDLETWTPNVLSNTTGGIHPGEMMIFSSVRQTGKSMYMKMLKNRMYNTNLCKEITFTGQQLLTEFTINWGKPVSKYKFSRAKWHTVEIGDGMWRLGLEYNEIIEWCTEQFGKHPNKPDAWSRWWVGVGEIHFRDEKDFVFYKLKWS